MWPDRRFLDLVKTEYPIVLAPMAGVMDTDLVIAVAQGGGLGSLPCAMLSAEKAREQVSIVRQRVSAPVCMNFFCHTPVEADASREAGWRRRLGAYYQEHGLDPAAPIDVANRAPFDAAMCTVVEELKPEVVSFHFGLPEPGLLKRVKATGAIVMGSATVVREAVWLEDHGADVIIAQGAEAGGHRGMFLTDRLAEQVGNLALVPQVVDAVDVPVIAAGGIADRRGVAAAFALGADAAQVGTAFLATAESAATDAHRTAIRTTSADEIVLTRAMSGRLARGARNRAVRAIEASGTIAPFPMQNWLTGRFRTAAGEQSLGALQSLWMGQAAPLVEYDTAAEVFAELAAGVSDAAPSDARIDENRNAGEEPAARG